MDHGQRVSGKSRSLHHRLHWPHYQSVINVVDAYCVIRKAEGGDPHRDGVEELLASFENVGGSAGWAKAVDNRKPAHTKPGALLEAEVIHRAALALKGLKGGGIFTTADMHAESTKDDELKRIKKAWLRLPSHAVVALLMASDKEASA